MAEGLNKLSGLGALMKSRQVAPTAQPEIKPTASTATGGSPSQEKAAIEVIATLAVMPVKSNPLAGKLGGLSKLSGAQSHTQAATVSTPTSLDDFAASEDMGEIPPDLEHESNAFKSAFTDETPADKPMREVPANCDSQMKLFIELMDNMYDTELRQDLELLSGMIRSIMVELKANPQYIQQVRKEDIRTWVQAMRQTMGLAKIKKAEKQEKRKTGTTASKAKSKKSDEMFDDVFAELGIVAD